MPEPNKHGVAVATGGDPLADPRDPSASPPDPTSPLVDGTEYPADETSPAADPSGVPAPPPPDVVTPVASAPPSLGAAEPPPRRKWRRGLGRRKRKTTADVVAENERRARRKKAVELLVSGQATNYRDLARQLGVGVYTAYKDVQRELHAPSEVAETARKIATARRMKELGKLNAVEAQLMAQLVAAAKAGQPVPLNVVSEIAKLSLTKGRHMKAIEAMTVPALPQRFEHTGAGGGPIDLRAMDDAQLRDLGHQFLLPDGASVHSAHAIPGADQDPNESEGFTDEGEDRAAGDGDG